jgi:hypothetical protein
MKNFSLTSVVLIAVAIAVTTAQAAPQKPNLKPQPLGKYIRSGVVVGGIAGDGFSILRVQKLTAPDGAERLVILYGNGFGQPMKTEPVYFHINVDEKRGRVSIDLAQVQKTAVDERELRKLFSGSKLIASTELTMDPIDLSTNILLSLKQATDVRAAVDDYKGSRTLVIDLRPTK